MTGAVDETKTETETKAAVEVVDEGKEKDGIVAEEGSYWEVGSVDLVWTEQKIQMM